MKMRLLLVLFALCSICNVWSKKDVPSVIFETDMGNDIDDALALDLLFKYQDMGKIKLIAVMSNKDGLESARYIDIMNTWYGYPKTPIGIVRGGYVEKQLTNYAKQVSEMETDGKPAFKRTVRDVAQLPDAHTLYRKILAKVPDQSVIVISTGFSTNLARLLDTQADAVSPLSGRDLIAKKIKYFSVMAGRFDQPQYTEYNVGCDIPSCRKFFAECPVPIVVSPFEVGLAVLYPGKSIQEDFTWTKSHPMVEAYVRYIKMPYDRPTWDVTSVLEVVEPNKFMTRTPAGTITIDEAGHSSFREEAGGKHCYLTITPAQGERIKEFFVETISKKPKKAKI